MKIKTLIPVIMASFLLSVQVSAETPFTRDFTFGLSDDFNAVKAVSDDDDAYDTLDRFTQVRNELPDEIPVFQPYEIKAKHEIYIAKNGNDTNPGTKELPVKSFDVAFSLAAESERDGGVVIYIREGIYDASDGITIPEDLSGTEKNPTFISAYPGEAVTLTGGININGKDFKVADDETAMRKLPESSKGKVYSVNLKELGYTKYPGIRTKLKVDDTEYTLARWPNSGTVKMAEYKGADGKDGVIDIGPVTNGLTGNEITGNTGQGFEFQVINPRPFSWENDDYLYMYGSFASEYLPNYQHIRTLNPEKQSIRTYTHEEYGAKYDSHNTYYYLNVLEELDIPGEWYLDRNTGMLYIYPIADLSDSTVKIPMSSNTLVRFTDGIRHVVLNGITVSDSGGKGIVIEGYRNVVQNCTVSNISSNMAVEMILAKNCGIINSKLYADVSITRNLNEGKKYAHDSTNLRPTRNFIQNNYVIGGQINVRYGVQHIVSHNTVMNHHTMCIYLAETQETIIEYNEVVGGPWRTIDGGMVYHEGGVGNLYNHIRYNYLHHSTVKIRNTPFGIYLDDLSSNAFAYGNVIQQGTLFMHGGSRNVAYNNVIIDETVLPSIYNSDNYVRSDMGSSAFKNGWIKTDGASVYWNNNGFYKAGQITWKNRYPTVYAWFEGLQRLRKGALNSKYRFTEADKAWLAPQENVYKNNVIYNSNPVMGNTEHETGSLWENNYNVPEGTEIFEDYENRNYNIKPDSAVYDVIDDFEPLPPLEKIGVVTEIHPKINIGNIQPVYPINDPDERTFPSDISFKWTHSPIATYYFLEIARDKEFTDLIGKYQTKENSYIFTGELDIDSEYYWRVTAQCYGVAVEKAEVVMDAAVFRTYTYEEAAANTTLDLTAFETQYAYVQSVAETITEASGTDIGIAVYKVGTKEKLAGLVESSKKRVEGYALQREVDNEVRFMKKELINILMENAEPYARSYSADDISMWNGSSKSAVIEAVDGAVSIKGPSGSVIAYDNRLLAPGEKVSLKMNFGKNTDWDAFGVKQVETKGKSMVTAAKGYYIIVKRDLIELQKYPSNSGNILTEVVNAGSIIKPDTYHDVEVSCTPEGDGVRIVFKVDGNIIIDYSDETDPITDLGYFSIQAFAGGINIK